MIFTEGHSLAQDLNQVHQILNSRNDFKSQAAIDEKRAQKMEYYLRMFKIAGNQRDDSKPQYQSFLEGDAMEKIALQVGQSLGIGNYSLFRNEHRWYLDSSARWGADDVFEAELAKLLEVAADRAVQKHSNINIGVGIVGKQSGNVSKEGLALFMQEYPEIINEVINENKQQIINSTRKNSMIIKPPTAKSGKVDVTGYNSSWVVEAELQDQWKDFIQLFAGARFTVKNYKGNNNMETIHLGNSDLYKAFYGTLTETLGIRPEKDATHIYYHTINSNHTEDLGVGEHIIHIRFMYELTGEGLYDEEGNKINGADFFIYNDPTSNNIYVRSTKSMISKMIDYVGNVKDPLHSDIVILKESFT